MNIFDFPETHRALDGILNILKCVKCSNLPKQGDVFYVSMCQHRYCEQCLMSQENCVLCNEKLDNKGAIKDVFSIGLLSKVKLFRDLLNNDEVNDAALTKDESNDIRNKIGLQNVENDDDVCCVTNLVSLPNGGDTAGNNLDKNVNGFTSNNLSDEPMLKANQTTKSKSSRKKGILKVRSKKQISVTESKLLGQKSGIIDLPPFSGFDSPPKLTQESGESFPRHNNTPPPSSQNIADEGSPDLPILTPYGPSTPEPGLNKKRILVPTRKFSDRIKKHGQECCINNGNELPDGREMDTFYEGLKNLPNQSKSKTQATPENKVSCGSSASSRSTTVSTRHSRFRSAIKTETASSPSSSSSKSSISHGSFDSSFSVEKRNAKGETSLHVAARLGKIDKIKQLLDAGANINAKDFAGWTPLHEAINGKTGNILQAVTILCEAGCQVSIPGMANETPLHEASRLGNSSILLVLLSHGANKNITNQSGQIPRDVAETEQIAAIIDDFIGPYIQDIEPIFCSEEEKLVIYFNYPMNESEVNVFQNNFGCQIASELSGEVTHIVFDGDSLPLPLTLDYLLGLLSGAWLIHSKWVVDSMCRKEVLDPTAYEIHGAHFSSENKNIYLNPNSDADNVVSSLPTLQLPAEDVPKRARTNREMRNPGLFHGINFYLYKNCSYNKLMKKDLVILIRIGDGVVIKRDPNPDTVDPLEHPTRFHANDPSHKMVLASHVILYNTENRPSKRHNMEHVKTLRVDWLIQSILQFSLQDPDLFLN